MRPYVFDEFFASGREESYSPFLTKRSKPYGKNLSLKSAIAASIFLCLSFFLSWHSPPLSHFFLVWVYVLVGTPALIGAWHDIQNWEINIDLLMTLAAFIALFLQSGIEGGLLLVLFALSHAMEDLVLHKAKGSLHSLHGLSPKFALALDATGTFIQKALPDIEKGVHILVKTGEVVPLDGIVREGSSNINLVHLTGESLPVLATPGTLVPAGSRNMDQALTLEVTKIASESTLAKIISLIEEAQRAKPQLQKILDRFGKVYAPTIILLTLFFALTLPFLSSLSFTGIEGSIYRSLAFLIAASPCALIIATPTAYLSAISACAKKGILLKGGVCLDALASTKKMVFDKTGTLTTGELTCTAIHPLTPTSISKEEALQIALGLERHVVHPIAAAIERFAKEHNLSPAPIENFLSRPGWGLEGTWQGKKVSIGSKRDLPSTSLPQEVSLEGFMMALLTIEEDSFLFLFSDPLRKGALPTIESLQKLQLDPILLSGDLAPNVERVAKSLSLSTFFAELSPEEKLQKIASLLEESPLAMVGDGMNDAPALARATIGISMGKIGSASAIDASDIVLLSDDLTILPWLVQKARQTKRIVLQNVSFALSIILFASTPALLGLVPLWLAVCLHEGGTVLVGLSSLRLLRQKIG